MPRPAVFSRKSVLESALDLVVEHGGPAATMTAVAQRLGAPSGSVYYRFGSRDLLLATLWLDTVETFQYAFLAELSADDARAGQRAALVPVRWVRERPREAALLLAHRREDLLSGEWPADTRGRAAALGGALDAGLRGFARRHLASARPPAVRRARLAVVDLPAGALRPYLRPPRPPPADLEELLLRAVTAVLAPSPAIGDSP